MEWDHPGYEPVAQNMHPLEDMDTPYPPQNGLEARLRALETFVRQLDATLKDRHGQIEARIDEKSADWVFGIREIKDGIKTTQHLLHNPQDGAFHRLAQLEQHAKAQERPLEDHATAVQDLRLRLDRLEQALLAQNKARAWWIDLAKALIAVVVGLALGKFLGK